MFGECVDIKGSGLCHIVKSFQTLVYNIEGELNYNDDPGACGPT